jgi:hypothetical protein
MTEQIITLCKKMSIPLPIFTKKDVLYENTSTGYRIPTSDFFSTSIVSTIACNMRGTTFDYVNSLFTPTNPLPQFTQKSWTSFGSVIQNVPVGTTALWAKDCPNCIQATTTDNHGLYMNQLTTSFRWITVCARVRVEQLPVSGQPMSIWSCGRTSPQLDGFALRVFQNSSNQPQFTFLVAGVSLTPFGPNLSLNTWYSVIVCLPRRNQYQFYVDGVSYSASAGFVIPPTSTFTLLNGCGGGITNDSFVGSLTDFMIMNRGHPVSLTITDPLSLYFTSALH